MNKILTVEDLHGNYEDCYYCCSRNYNFVIKTSNKEVISAATTFLNALYEKHLITLLIYPLIDCINENGEDEEEAFLNIELWNLDET